MLPLLGRVLPLQVNAQVNPKTVYKTEAEIRAAQVNPKTILKTEAECA
ncbi:MAG TPA: hypothetical protein VNO18_22185 [Xanthobacteraceae bacterium]|nr:hypothetical protein [Xanthobacteraceae bacterium]